MSGPSRGEFSGFVAIQSLRSSVEWNIFARGSCGIVFFLEGREKLPQSVGRSVYWPVEYFPPTPTTHHPFTRESGQRAADLRVCFGIDLRFDRFS